MIYVIRNVESFYLVKAGKRVVFSFFCYAPPVVEYSAISAGWICKGHPLPGTNLFTAQLGFNCSIALSCITWQQWGRISTNSKDSKSH